MGGCHVSGGVRNHICGRGERSEAISLNHMGDGASGELSA